MPALRLESLGFGRNAKNRAGIAELLASFFRAFAHDFTFRDSVVSIREGRLLTKEEKEWTSKNNSRTDRFWWCIEDPFELDHDLGSVVHDPKGQVSKSYLTPIQHLTVLDTKTTQSPLWHPNI